MAEKHSPEQPRRSSRLLKTEKPDDQIGRSTPVKHTIATGQLDGHTDNGGNSSHPLKQTNEAKKGKKTARPAKKKINRKGVSGAVKKAAQPKKGKKAAKPKTGGQSLVKAQPQDIVGSVTTKIQVISPRRSGTANHLPGDLASHSVDVGSHASKDQPQESNQPGGADQPPDAMHESNEAQSGNQSSNHIPSSTHDASLAPLSNGQCGEWHFGTELPMSTVPAYTHSLPHDQQDVMTNAACQVSDLEATKESQQGNLVKPQLNPSNEQTGISSSRARASDPRRDVIFYQKPIPDDNACADPTDDDGAGSEASDESFDISRYSLQTAEEGKWFDPKFDLTEPSPSVDRLVAGKNCPPNVLQQCDLRINPHGAPPRFIPSTPAVQGCSPRKSPEIVSTNVEGQQGNSRGDKEGLSHRTGQDYLQKRDNIDFFTRFGNLMGRSSQVQTSQPNATCDSHDCKKELGEEYITCARCHQARYCEKFCQIYDWLVHLPTCNLHPEANAQEVTTLEEWATEMWNGAAKAVKDAEEVREDEPIDAGREHIHIGNPEPHTSESSARPSSTASDAVVMGDG
ncbi:hypothetical protein N0V82_010065 [Gnomoniopsis sp. IMI 355080]|nr:hypothetical protein N0V82_010065 [Gnomoniopsis sp. IMI 355080]